MCVCLCVCFCLFASLNVDDSLQTAGERGNITQGEHDEPSIYIVADNVKRQTKVKHNVFEKGKPDSIGITAVVQRGSWTYKYERKTLKKKHKTTLLMQHVHNAVHSVYNVCYPVVRSRQRTIQEGCDPVKNLHRKRNTPENK